MAVHFVLLILICIFGLFIYNNKKATKARNKRFILVSFFLIFLVQALRSQYVGWDSHTYYLYYHILADAPVLGYKWEPLFVLLNKVANLISSDPQTLFILASAIINILIGKFFYDNLEEGESAFWVILFYLTLRPYFNSMNLLRQYLAIAVAIQAYTVLKRDNSLAAYGKAFALIIIGFCFHRTAIVYFLIPIVMSFRKFDVKKVFLVVVAACLVAVTYERIVNLVIDVFPVYAKYLSTDFLEGLSSSGYHFIIAAVKLALLVFYYRKKREDTELGPEVLFCVMSIAMTIMRLRVSFAVRAGYYFDLPTFLFMMKAPQDTTVRNKQVIHSLLFLACVISFVYLLLSPTGSRGTSDYTFFWQI